MGETFSLAVNGYGSFSGITFQDAVSAPEPSTWAMMLGGLGILLVVLRRRQGSLV